MKIRLSNNVAWASPEFEASTAQDVKKGVRDGWEAFIVKSWNLDTLGHPSLAYRSRIAEIERWVEERADRDVPSDTRQSWVAQERLWRYKAARTMGELTDSVRRADLALCVQVQGQRGDWLTISAFGNGATGETRVERSLSLEDAQEVLDHAVSALDHEARIIGLASDIAKDVRGPSVRLVEDREDS